MFATIDWEVIYNIGYLTLRTPPKNEMNTKFFDEFADLISELHVRPYLKGLIIKSEGRHFSSGANIGELLQNFDQSLKSIPDQIRKNKKSFLKLKDFTFPVIATLKGICLGAAFEMALFTHFRISTKNVTMGLPETSFDLIPGLGGIGNMVNLTGKSRALEYVLTGNSIDSEKGVDLGIIDLITEKHQLISNAENLIHFIGTFPTYDPALKNYFLDKYKEENDKNIR